MNARILTSRAVATTGVVVLTIFTIEKISFWIFAISIITISAIWFDFYLKHKQEQIDKDKEWFEKAIKEYLRTGFSPKEAIDKRTDWTES